MNFKVESWVWYGIAISMVLLRLIARYQHFKSIKRLQIEDWFMTFIACLYTILIVSLNICTTTNTNLIDPHDIPTLTPEDIAERTFGSKMILLVEQCMCAVQWGTKACLLMLYWRLTENLVQGRLVKGAAIYVGGTYAIMEILYFGVWCRPFHDYWQTPTDNVQCTTALHHLIVNMVFNLTSDILIMSVPLPLLMKAHLEIKRKILLVFPFTLGFFSIICAILSKHLSFTQPFSGEWVFWYAREASTVMIVSNMPYTWGLLRRLFEVHSFFGSSPETSRANSIGRVRTRDTGMEMYGGEVRELQGVPLSNSISNIRSIGEMEDLEGHNGQSEKAGKLFSGLTLWRKKEPDWRMQRLPSTAASQNTPVGSRSGVIAPQWTDLDRNKDNTEIYINPESSSSSAASGGRLSNTVPLGGQRGRDGDAIHKLYRLNDDDLMIDIERERQRSDAREPG